MTDTSYLAIFDYFKQFYLIYGHFELFLLILFGQKVLRWTLKNRGKFEICLTNLANI
jgi:hypothetical protein